MKKKKLKKILESRVFPFQICLKLKKCIIESRGKENKEIITNKSKWKTLPQQKQKKLKKKKVTLYFRVELR